MIVLYVIGGILLFLSLIGAGLLIYDKFHYRMKARGK